MSDHLLILSPDEARLLGSLYSLGAMSVLALDFGPESAEEKLFQESRRLLKESLGLGNFESVQRAVRDKVLELIEEMQRDAKESDAK